MKAIIQHIPDGWVITKEVRDVQEAMELAKKRLSKNLATCYTSIAHIGSEIVSVKTTYVGRELEKAIKHK